MAKQSQTRTKPRKPLAAREKFTPEAVHSILKGDPCGRHLQPDDPVILDVANKLTQLQLWAVLQETWQPQKARNERLAAALRTVLRELPSIFNEVGEACAVAERESNALLLKPLLDARACIVDLGRAAEAIGENRLLMHPMTRHTSRRWQDYAVDLETIFREGISGFSRAAVYRVLPSIILEITGETTTEDAVETWFKKTRDTGRHTSVQVAP